MPLPHDPGPHWGEVGIHGLHRPREWDAVATVGASGLPGDAATFVALPDGRLLLEEGAAGLDPGPLAAALGLSPPYRAEAVRRSSRVWAVAARRIAVVELTDDPGGTVVEVVRDEIGPSVRVDGEPTFVLVPELDRLALGRFRTYVVEATRLDGALWEVVVSPL